MTYGNRRDHSAVLLLAQSARICYGYISTGDMIIFLHVLDHPGHVEYHLGTHETSTLTIPPAYSTQQ